MTAFECSPLLGVPYREKLPRLAASADRNEVKVDSTFSLTVLQILAMNKVSLSCP